MFRSMIVKTPATPVTTKFNRSDSSGRNGFRLKALAACAKLTTLAVAVLMILAPLAPASTPAVGTYTFMLPVLYQGTECSVSVEDGVLMPLTPFESEADDDCC